MAIKNKLVRRKEMTKGAMEDARWYYAERYFTGQKPAVSITLFSPFIFPYVDYF